MSRTYRTKNCCNKGRDDSPSTAKCWPDNRHDRGHNTEYNDHGVYGAGGARRLKIWANHARRSYSKRLIQKEIKMYYPD